MGHKSKFMFPVPGRKTKEQAPTISAPLSKVQKILGTGEINIDSLSVPSGNSPQWDTRSAGGISISVSESSTGQAANNNGHRGSREEGEDSKGRDHLHLAWEQESGVIPRILRNGLGSRSHDNILNGKKSTGAMSADYLEVMTDASSIRRQQSSSTIHSHYEKSNVPLSVSQQTSNSAIARGLPPKAKALLDVEGAHINRSDSKKKKPPRLDFLMLRGKHRKQHLQQQQEQQYQPPEVEPVLGNSYVMKSPSSLASPKYEESMQSQANHESAKRATKVLTGYPGAPSLAAVGPNRLRASSDTTRQLYDHYEEMLAKHEPSPDIDHVDHPESPIESTICGSSPINSPPFFAPLGAPSKPIVRKRSENWVHTRRPSRESEMTTFSGGPSVTTQPLDAVIAKNDYASSISSRYTRTSKASRTDKSLLESDRQITSVLSLSDSESDEDAVLSATRSSPFSQRSLHEDPRAAGTPNRRPGSAQRSAPESRGSNRASPASGYSQSNSRLLPQAPLPQAPPKLPEASRVRSNSTIRSNHSSSASTVMLPLHTATPLEPSCFPDRSTRMSDASSLAGSKHRDSEYSIREAKAVSMRPLVSTTDAPSWVPTSMDSAALGQTPPPAAITRPGTRTSSRYSRGSEPMSPMSSQSVEIYLEEPTEPPATATTMRSSPPAGETNSARAADGNATSGGERSSSEEPDKSRFMAVTRQEEMLLAALRNKRARMRENIIAELDTGSDGGSPHRDGDEADPVSRLEVPATGPGGRPVVPKQVVPRRRSSLMGSGQADKGGRDQRLSQEELHALRSASARPNTAAGDRRPAPSETAASRAAAAPKTKAPGDLVLMYLESPPLPQGQQQQRERRGGISNTSEPVRDDFSHHDFAGTSFTGEEEREGRSLRPRTRTNAGDGERGRSGHRSNDSQQRDAHDFHDYNHRDYNHYQPAEPQQQQHRRARSTSNPRSSDNNHLHHYGAGLPPAASSATGRLQRVPEAEERETDDVPEVDDADYDIDEDDDDEESIIDFDAFPAPASHHGSALFGAPPVPKQQEHEQEQHHDETDGDHYSHKDSEENEENETRTQGWGPRSFTPQFQQQRSDTPTSMTHGVGTPGSTTSSNGHVKGKKSRVRLSAVGRKNSLLPWLGDED